MAEAYTISVSQGDHAEEHSRRSYTPASADYSLREQNEILFDSGNDKEHFNDFFRPSIEAYNARQKRSDRKKSLDYYEALLNGTEGYGKGKQQEKPVYDDVVQIGNRETNGITKRTFDVDHWRQLKAQGHYDEAAQYVKQHMNHDKEQQELRKILTDVMQEVLDESANSREYRKAHGLPPGKYDNILIHRMIGHGDEPNGTFHFDFAYTIFTDDGNNVRKNGKQNGMGTRVSMTKGLAAMGFRTKKDSFALEQFRESIKQRIQEKMEEKEYQRDIKGEHRRHLSTQMYEIEQRAKEAQAKVDTLTTKKEETKKEVETAQAEVDTLTSKKSDLQCEVMMLQESVKDAEDKIAEAFIETEKLDKKKKEQDDTDERQKEKETTLNDQENRLREILMGTLLRINPEAFNEDGEYTGEAETLGEIANELEAAFQKKEDALGQQMKIATEHEAAAKDACMVFRKAGAIQQEIAQETVPDSLMEFLRKQSYRILGTTLKQRMNKNGSDWEYVKVVKYDKDGKPVWEDHNPLKDYETYLKGRQRSRALTEAEQKIMDRAAELSKDYGE